MSIIKTLVKSNKRNVIQRTSGVGREDGDGGHDLGGGGIEYGGHD